jgi:hypothetical protein
VRGRSAQADLPFLFVADFAVQQAGEVSREIRSRDPDRAGVKRVFDGWVGAAMNAYTL